LPCQALRKVLAGVLVAPQSLCASPMLDARLFQYDEKLVSTVVRARSFSDAPIKIASRSHPRRLRFVLHPDHFEPQAQSVRRPVKPQVTYHFHPVQPFVMAVLQTFVHPPQITIYTRM
jgi:De-etiolated protein 1 Det1